MTLYTSNRYRVVLSLLFSVLIANSPVFAAGPAPTQQQIRFEIRFMEDMIDHHAMAVMMAEMCLERAVHPELRQLCQNIISSQTAEIRLMQGWLLTWYGISYTPKTPEAGIKRMERMHGQEFEIEFMEMMSRHHAEAIEEATDALLKGYHKELRDLAENIVKAQAPEINQMRTWLCQWYGECGAVRG